MKAYHMKTFTRIIIAALLIIAATGARKPQKALIITGQNNHNWPVSHVAIERILSSSGLFKVETAISPAKGEDMSGFKVDFRRYDVVVVDYNGDEWCDEMKSAFERYAADGGGIVMYHAADNSFPQWKAYNEMNALGGWEGRNEKDGPYVYWKDGALVHDMTPGPGGSHGAQHEYVMECRDAAHPIVAGLPERWKHGRDELYDRMRGPGNIGDLLYTAYAPQELRGSGRNEPLIFTVDYGRARLCPIMIGHAGPTLEDNPAMQCVGFQTLLLRACEWCATGKVRQPVPDDFPTEGECSFRKEYR